MTTEDPQRLMDEFPKLLEKVSCRLSGGIILVIDAADLCQVLSFPVRGLVTAPIRFR